MGITIQVASDREHDQTKTVLPSEYARGVYITNPPSAEALKLMHFLIAAAGAGLADDVVHQFKLTDLNAIQGMRRHTRKTLEPLFQELAACVLTIEDVELQQTVIGGFLDQAIVNYSDAFGGDLLVKWNFRKTFRWMASESNHWAIIDRQTLFALSSKYSILLFQYFSSLQKLKYKTSQTFSVEELRLLLGISAGKMPRYSSLSQRVIKPALSEISRLSRFTLTATPKKIGRSVVAIEISWEPKPVSKPANKRIGRPLKRVSPIGDTSPVTPALTFPATGSIEFSKPWNEITKLNGNGKDKDLIATDFRNWCQARNIPLDRPNIEKTFKGFCKKAMP